VASPNAKRVALWSYFSCIPISAPSLSICLFRYPSPPIIFTPPLPFSKEVNKKLSYRRQNALSNAVSKRILCLCVRQSRLAGRTHNVLNLSLLPFVCLFVCLLPTCGHYTSKTKKKTSMQIGRNLSCD